jgi:hypothetical protein
MRLFDSQHLSSYWICNNDLGFSGDTSAEWDQYRQTLIYFRAFLHDTEDDLMRIGGDHYRFPTVKNIYWAIVSTRNLRKVGILRQSIWKSNIQLKIKLFIWLAAKGKILTWDTLQTRGWEGPGCFYFCKQDSENIYHLFLQCPFTKSVWEKVIIDQNLKNSWKGNTLSNCFRNWFEDKPALL